MLQDVRYALRVLLKSPGFAGVAIFALALGIGANSAIFSLIDAVLFRPLPFHKPEEVVRIFSSDEHGADVSNSSYPVFTDYRDQAKSFAGVAAYANWNALDLSIAGAKPERVYGNLVSGNFFDVLGVQSFRGRLIHPYDDRAPGNSPVLVLSYRTWKKKFAEDAGIIKKIVRVNGHPFTIIGVAPPNFSGAGLDSSPEVWLPISMLDQAQPEFAGGMLDRRFSWVDMVGRLKSGVTLLQAQAELRTIAERRAAKETEEMKDPSASLMTARQAATEWDLLPAASKVSWLLFGVMILVLFISCSVVAGLFLVRAEQRHREIVVRMAIGAEPVRIIRQLLIESTILASLGAAAGLLIATWISELLIAASPTEFPIPLDLSSSIFSGRVFFFTTAVSLLSALFFGLLPAIRASRFDLMSVLKGQLGVAGNPQFSLHAFFIIGQVALSTILLIGAGLLLRTLWKVNQVDPGFRSDRALVASLDIAKEGYTEETGLLFFEELLRRVRATAGVRSAAFARIVPIQNSGMRITIDFEGFRPRNIEEKNVELNVVSPGYFATLGLPLLRGRDFQPGDKKGTPLVVIANQSMADHYWAGQNPIGKRLKKFGPSSEPAEIIGVVGDAYYHSLRTPARPMIYVSLAQSYMASSTLLIRTTEAPENFTRTLTTIVGSMNRSLPLYHVSTLQQKIAGSQAQERMIAGLLAAFGIVALTLAAFGLYSILAYTTELRTREFGIRIALGATPRRLLSSIFSRGLMLTVSGLLLGFLGSFLLMRLIRSLLFGVQPGDPLTFSATFVVLALVSMLASYVPARRATKVNPIEILRYE